MMRQITFYKFEIGTRGLVKADDGRYDEVEQVICTAEASSMSRSEIRAAIKDAGYTCPRGTDVFARKVGKVQYKFTTDDLLSIAKERVEVPFIEGGNA